MSTRDLIEVPAIIEQRADGTLFFAPRPPCVGCDGSCGVALARRGVDVPLPTRLRPGETVTIEVSARALRGAASTAFGLPLAGLLLGAAFASIGGPADAGAIIGSLCGLMIGLAATAWRSAAFGGRGMAAKILDRAGGFVNNGAPCEAPRRNGPNSSLSAANSNIE